MPDATILILPGLDGTDLMLGRFAHRCSEHQESIVGTLPDDTTMDYPSLADHFSSVVRKLPACHIIAESFSGPIAILLATRYPDIVTRLTLVASFVTTPVPPIASFLPWAIIFRLPIPSLIARYFFVGECKSLIPDLRNAIRQNTTSILHHRLTLVQNVDVSLEYSELNCPLSYLRPTNDRLVPQRCVDKIMELNPATIVHEIEGSHLILETQPESSWRRIAG
jgi:pimeloyl-ACP methyl ester carboxylesterase